MPLMLLLGRWWGIRHAKNGKKYVLGRGNCRCQSSEAAGTWWAGGVQEGPYGWSPAHESALFLQQMRLPPGRSSTRHPPDPQHPRWGCASCEAGSNSDTLSEWLWLYPTCSSRISPHWSMKRESLFLSPLNLGDVVMAAMKTIEWKWCHMISEAGSEKVTWLVSNLSHVGHLPLEPSHHPVRKPNQACEGRLHMEKNWSLESTASVSTTHESKWDFSWFQPPAFETFSLLYAVQILDTKSIRLW